MVEEGTVWVPGTEVRQMWSLLELPKVLRNRAGESNKRKETRNMRLVGVEQGGSCREDGDRSNTAGFGGERDCDERNLNSTKYCECTFYMTFLEEGK